MLAGLIGGALIGLAATLLWIGAGRIAGVSGLLREAAGAGGDRRVALAFVAGLVLAGAVAALFRPGAPGLGTPWPLTLAAGLLIGVGTYLSNGCTSGHGVCGLSRLSRRSFAATATFMVVGGLTVWVKRLLESAP